MSDTDSFIDEVSEEVRRDQLYGVFRKYGWIAVSAVVLIVGGASLNEYRKAQTTAAAEATGDALLAALDENESSNRVQALGAATLEAPEAEVVRQFLLSAEQVNAGETAAAATSLETFLNSAPETSQIYKDIAELKALVLAGDTISVEDRRARLETLANPGTPLALIASEQIALLDIETGNTDAAIERLQGLIVDAEASAGLRQRASQLIVALGGEPETLPSLATDQ
ncbi:MAG: hypothetical protein VX444_10580 [Pseudomonadota bacterium]|nr:hypothetical protein [Pseudomonadota bacterium]